MKYWVKFEVSKRINITQILIQLSLKVLTKQRLSRLYPESANASHIIQNEKIIISLKFDLNPPLYANTGNQVSLVTIPYKLGFMKNIPVCGKIHAVIARSWKNREREETYTLHPLLELRYESESKHLEARLKQTKTIEKIQLN